jgi:hypothetical protein
MELGRHLLRSDSDGAAGAYALIVSSLGVFMLWAVMARLLASLNSWLVGLVMGGGLHVVFRGFPISEAPAVPRPRESPE